MSRYFYDSGGTESQNNIIKHFSLRAFYIPKYYIWNWYHPAIIWAAKTIEYKYSCEIGIEKGRESKIQEGKKQDWFAITQRYVYLLGANQAGFGAVREAPKGRKWDPGGRKRAGNTASGTSEKCRQKIFDFLYFLPVAFGCNPQLPHKSKETGRFYTLKHQFIAPLPMQRDDFPVGKNCAGEFGSVKETAKGFDGG